MLGRMGHSRFALDMGFTLGYCRHGMSSWGGGILDALCLTHQYQGRNSDTNKAVSLLTVHANELLSIFAIQSTGFLITWFVRYNQLNSNNRKVYIPSYTS